MKKMIVPLILCIVSAAASAQGLPAAPNGAPTLSASPAANERMTRALAQLQSRFAQANTTHDGKLTREQAQAGMPMVAQHFDAIDSQRAGYVTLAQIEDFMRERAAASR
ncbi:EF-hand domain-containing protein [Burkholderia sp. Ax-1719]|uniref:EF-hand domain-containing protein n=1 Tax=Burkholderia sp. Ax-1719 TaxID=2608334 RepID=UPI0014204677|nr:EF-hand domain-containing protein [Burkholderia sp. Ax-1719]NIE65794.1 EF-hand domain-containing protein [Burkholderia sp. Ax-1719]